MNYEDVLLKINGVALPAPIEMNVELNDIDADSVRNVKDAVLERNRIRANIHKISLSYGTTDLSEVTDILKAISPSTFSVELYDMVAGKRTVKKMYAGPKSYQYIVCDGVWIKALKFNLTEC